jgi:hypothetical protein
MGNENEEDRIRTLKEVFEILQMSGVDLTDPDSVAVFIEDLRSVSPEFASSFESFLDFLLEPEGQGMGEGPEMGMNLPPQEEFGSLASFGGQDVMPQEGVNMNMQNHETLQEGIRGRGEIQRG